MGAQLDAASQVVATTICLCTIIAMSLMSAKIAEKRFKAFQRILCACLTLCVLLYVKMIKPYLAHRTGEAEAEAEAAQRQVTNHRTRPPCSLGAEVCHMRNHR